MQVLEVSRGGALIEGAARLTPGSAIELRFIGTDHLFLVRGRIVRCYVAAVTSQGLSYRAAIAFETQLDLTEQACSSDG